MIVHEPAESMHDQRNGSAMAQRFEVLPQEAAIFEEDVAAVDPIEGEKFASYMGVPDIEADHVTLVLENVSPRTEIQLLRYRHPDPLPDAHIRDLYIRSA